MSEFVTLGDHIRIQKGKPPSKVGDVGADAEPYLSPEFLRGRDAALMAKAAPDAVRCADGDTVLLWDGSNAGEFFKGRSGLVASTMAKITPSEAFHGDFFHHVAKHAEIWLKSQTSGTGIPHVDRELLESIRAFCPDEKQQQRIAGILDTVDTAVRDTEAVIAKLKAVKQGLLHDLLTRGIDANGELRPQQSEAPHLYRPSPLGWIPKEWSYALLDEIATRGSGHTPSKSVPSYWNGGVKWVSLADSHRLDKIYIKDTDKEISALGIANSSAVLHPGGTVILSRDAGIGKSAVLAAEMAVSQHFMTWRCGETLDKLYLYFHLQREKPRFEAIAIGSTIQTIGLQFFKMYLIQVPPLPEQKMIVAILMNAEEQLTENMSHLSKLNMYKSALMDDLLTGRVRVTPLLETADA